MNKNTCILVNKSSNGDNNIQCICRLILGCQYIHRCIYTTIFGNVAGKPLSGERAAGLGKLVGRKLGEQYKTRLRCINSTT